MKDGLRQRVEVTNLGEFHWMLGLDIQCDRIGCTIHLSQRVYIDAILRRFNFDDLKPLSTPMDVQVRLTSEQSPKGVAEFVAMRDMLYREAVGPLNWAALATCPGIAFAVATVARFAANPGPVHWEAVKRIYRYLSGTRNLWLFYGETKHTLVGYADADGSTAEDRRAITEYAFLIDGGALSWSSKLQDIVSLSTTESGSVVATHGMKEALWLRSLLLSEPWGTTLEVTPTLPLSSPPNIPLTSFLYSERDHVDVHHVWVSLRLPVHWTSWRHPSTVLTKSCGMPSLGALLAAKEQAIVDDISKVGFVLQGIDDRQK